MKAIFKNTEAVSKLITPLKNISSIFNAFGEDFRFRFEIESDKLIVATKDANSSFFAIFTIAVSEIFETFEKTVDEIGVYDTKQLLMILDKYTNKNLYKKEDKLSISFDGVNKIVLSCNKDKDVYYSADIAAITKGKRDFNINAVEESSKFELKSQKLKKLLVNMDCYPEHDVITFEGEKGNNELNVKIHLRNIVNKHYSEFFIDEVEIIKDVEISFDKKKIKSILNCSDDYNISFYNIKGKDTPAVGRFEYVGDCYNVVFFFAPKPKKD